VTIELAQPGSLWGNYPIRKKMTARKPALTMMTHRLFSITGKAPTQAAAKNRASAIYKQLQAIPNKANLTTNLQTLRANLLSSQCSATAIDHALLQVAVLARNCLNWSAFSSQIECAILLIEQSFVELATGEGKSLAMAMAASVLAMTGSPVHALTANEYLAKRDAELFEPLYRALELSVSYAGELDPVESQREAFLADITYTTARCVGFAFLKDSLGRQDGSRILRGLCCALIDEADVILLDEAITPLVLSHQVNDGTERLTAFKAVELARQLAIATDWVGTKQARTLTEKAQLRLEQLPIHPWLTAAHRQQQLLTALHALHDLQLGRDYLIAEKEIQIIDTYSGRVAVGRQWGNGLQAMVAVKEGLPTPKRTAHLASIQYPALLQRYFHLAGLSGTLLNDKAEIEKNYQCPVVLVKPHHPLVRTVLRPIIVQSLVQAQQQLVEHLALLNRNGRPVLIATQDVNQTKSIARALENAGLSATALSADNELHEAKVIARAGHRAAITIATQMAGRGTDIKLDPSALQAGGLAVISFQINQSPRTDRQVMGRAGRQGQPGSVQQWIIKEALIAQGLSLGVVSKAKSSQELSTADCLSLYAKIQDSNHRQDRFQRGLAIQSDRQWAKRLLFAKTG
jgi:preprotein translocase subunit SecA